MKKIRYVLFLDLDGVINNHKDRGDRDHIRTDFTSRVSVSNIGTLNELFGYCYKNEIDVVSVSTWNIAGFRKVQRALMEVIGRVYAINTFVGATRYSHDLPHPVRSNEIQEWIDKQDEEIRFVIVDDNDDFTDEHKKHWVNIWEGHGLCAHHLPKIYEKFTSQGW